MASIEAQMISREEIERPRTPKELREFVAAMRAKVEGCTEEFHRANARKGLYKMFIDEVMPIALCADHLCCPDEYLLPVIGNQGYDANILDANCRQIGRVEIAKPFDGKTDAEDRRLLHDRGIGDVRISDFGEGLSSLAMRIVHAAREKALKDYGDATLLFVGVIDPPFNDEIPRLEAAAEHLRDALCSINYKAKRVLLVIPPLPSPYVISSS